MFIQYYCKDTEVFSLAQWFFHDGSTFAPQELKGLVHVTCTRKSTPREIGNGANENRAVVAARR